MSGTGAPVVTARERGLVGCRRCTKVSKRGTSHCPRCGTRLVSRDRASLSRVWAWWVAGVLAYIPANTYPMLRTRTLFQVTEDTIVAGAIKLGAQGAIGVAIIVILASVVIPLAKFFAIAFLALSVTRGSRASPGRRFLMYEVVEFIGRWSMIDVFVVAILSAVVQLSVAAAINPGIAALAFALSVIFTMLSAQSFDSRMIWDTLGDADDEEDAPEGAKALG
ncbi:MAG: paraquat-inducible protein A [Pseudomonadota bacterium]